MIQTAKTQNRSNHENITFSKVRSNISGLHTNSSVANSNSQQGNLRMANGISNINHVKIYLQTDRSDNDSDGSIPPTISHSNKSMNKQGESETTGNSQRLSSSSGQISKTRPFERKDTNERKMKDMVKKEKEKEENEKNDENKEKPKVEKNETTVYVANNGKKLSIQLKERTFSELYNKCRCSLDEKEVEQLSSMDMFIVSTNGYVIESDETVCKALEENESKVFQLIWKTVKKKIIKNALVIMIGISEYDDNNLSNVKQDINNFQNLFENVLHYTFERNKTDKMKKLSVQAFINKLIFTHELHENPNKYDGLIMIISGHGEEDGKLVTSEGDSWAIDKIRASFNCDAMGSFKNLPKILIIDICRGKNSPITHKLAHRGKDEIGEHGHDDDGFYTLWSTTSGYKVHDSALLSKCLTSTIMSKYNCGFSLQQMYKDIRTDVRNQSGGDCCVEIQQTIEYDIYFEQRKRFSS